MKQSATTDKKQTTPKFDWHSTPLTLATVITDSYKSTQNVRRFFREHCGAHFRFDVLFMAFMKTSVGITLQEAVDEWKRRERLNGKAKESTTPTEE